MKILQLLIFIYCFVELSSCKSKNISTQLLDPWYALTITSEENTVVTVFADSDIVRVKVIHTGDFFYHPKKIITNTLHFKLSKMERDSLYNLASDIITAPPIVNHHCTDYVGDLQIIVYYGQSCKKTINYSGVCNWNILSDKTMQLHSLLKRHMKNVFLGEDDRGRSYTGR